MPSPAYINILDQRGPTTFDQRAILQKRDNLRATWTKWQQIHKI